MEKKRIAGIDIVKFLAILFVISIHQIGNTNVLAMSLSGARAFVILTYRYLVMSCVPLFLIITGYLQNKKKPDKKFYKGIIPVLTSYVFISILCIIYNLYKNNMAVDVIQSIINIFNFSANGYAWYVEMYIGLFLVIPFMNYLWHAIESKKHKQMFLAVLAFLTIAPSIGVSLQTSHHVFNVFPDYWFDFYPVTYYFIGAYISEYKPKINGFLNVLLILLFAMAPVIVQFAVWPGGEFAFWIMNGFYSVTAFAIAILIFVLFYRRDIRITAAKKVVSWIAVSSLDIYLMSNLVEKLLYPYIPENTRGRLIICIAAVFAFSLAAAKLKSLLFWCVRKIFGK